MRISDWSSDVCSSDLPMSLIERHIREKIVLVGVTLPPETAEETEASLDELSLLVDTAGADEVGRITQRRAAPDPPTFVGKGKAEELREIALETDCDTVVFDNELSPARSEEHTSELQSLMRTS